MECRPSAALLSYEHGIDRDGQSDLWAFVAIDGLTVKTDTAKLFGVLKTDDDLEKQSLSPSALLQH